MQERRWMSGRFLPNGFSLQEEGSQYVYCMLWMFSEQYRWQQRNVSSDNGGDTVMKVMLRMIGSLTRS